MKVKFVVPRGCSCRSFMREIFPQVNAYRKTLGKRPMCMNSFYRLRRVAAERWLSERIERFPKNPAKWQGNPFLASNHNGGYVFSEKHANAILAMAVNCKLAAPRGIAVARQRRVAAKRRKQLAA
ncbi:MAG: hypothetical protein EBT15_08625 [Betaproteobacteria bacterium]|nr:hypothetical protein [Betaproteobacteria bacterium]